MMTILHRPRLPRSQAELSDELAPSELFRGYILIPLSEFGQSLDSPNLDTWLEGIRRSQPRRSRGF